MHAAQEYNHFCVLRKNAKLQPVKKDPFQSRKIFQQQKKITKFYWKKPIFKKTK